MCQILWPKHIKRKQALLTQFACVAFLCHEHILSFEISETKYNNSNTVWLWPNTIHINEQVQFIHVWHQIWKLLNFIF